MDIARNAGRLIGKFDQLYEAGQKVGSKLRNQDGTLTFEAFLRTMYQQQDRNVFPEDDLTDNVSTISVDEDEDEYGFLCDSDENLSSETAKRLSFGGSILRTPSTPVIKQSQKEEKRRESLPFWQTTTQTPVTNNTKKISEEQKNEVLQKNKKKRVSFCPDPVSDTIQYDVGINDFDDYQNNYEEDVPAPKNNKKSKNNTKEPDAENQPKSTKDDKKKPAKSGLENIPQNASKKRSGDPNLSNNEPAKKKHRHSLLLPPQTKNMFALDDSDPHISPKFIRGDLLSRRERRNRLKPLKFWKGERVEYHTSHTPVKVIYMDTPTSTTPARKPSKPVNFDI